MTDNEDDHKYGTKIQYDPLWRGPMQNIRSPTDRIWLIVFCIYLVIYIGCACYGFGAGDMKRFTRPSDHAGRTCGIDKSVKDKPYLMFLNLAECKLPNNSDASSACRTSTVCVSECPTENFIYSRGIPINVLKEKLICQTDVNLTMMAPNDIDIMVDNNKCAKWYLRSKPIHKNCIASEAWPGYEDQTATQKELNEIKTVILLGRALLKKAYDISKMAIRPAAVAIILGGVLTVICVILLKWIALPFFYGSIGLFVAFFVFGIYHLTVQYIKTNDKGLLFGLIVCIAIIVIVILCVIFFRKKIYLACQLIKESSKAVMHLPATLAFPILPCLLYLGIVILAGMFALSLASITTPRYTIEKLNGGQTDGCQCKNGSVVNYFGGQECKPDEFAKECSAYGQPCKFLRCLLDGDTSPGYVGFFHFINVFGFYWLIFFVSGFEFMVLGGTFATWYWSSQKESVGNYTLIESLCRTTKFHLGTIAVGSLILAVIQIIRMILNSLREKLKESNHQAAVAIMCICQCLFDLLESVMNYLSYNAYILCAIHGKSFCQSAKNAFNLLMRNILKIVVVDTVASWLFFLAKLLITIIIVGATLLFFRFTLKPSEPDEFSDEGAIAVVAVVLTIIGTFVISSVFFNVQGIAVNTIFLCFIEDTERNDGSDERPYYMSNKLEKLLHQ